MDITRVDFRRLEPGKPSWQEARAAVTASMVAHGCVVIVHDGLGPELRRALFGRAMPELFALPVEAKQRNVCDPAPIGGYLAQRPLAMTLESLRVPAATDAGSVRDFANLLWPHGNPAFCDTIGAFAKNMLKLEQTVARMVLESLGVQRDHVGSHLDSLVYGVRLSHYRALQDRETDILLQPHRDASMLSIIVQHDVEGLEVQANDGSWLAMPPEPDTLTVLAGELLTVVTNGRVPACVHRVRTPSNRERFSVLFDAAPKCGCTARAAVELVDNEHPLLYNPCNFDEYVKFRFIDEGRELKRPIGGFLRSER